MYQMSAVEDTEKLQAICDFINDMIADTDIRATPGTMIIAWQRVFVGKGQYPIDQAEAYYRLGRARFNPKQLIEFAVKKFA